MKKSLDGIWIIDVDGKTVFANARMAEILGATVDQMIGQKSFDYVYPEDVPSAQRLFEAKVRGDTVSLQTPARGRVWRMGQRAGHPVTQRGRSIQRHRRNLHGFD